MVLTTFSWPYGGRQVSLSGSFDRWSQRIPMTLLEGSSTVFQTVCNLAPGYHQYKFLVDGVWQHDQRRTVVTDEIGIINNIILVEESENGPSVSPLGATGSIMDVDNGGSEHAASLLGGVQQAVMEPISAIDTFRHWISMFLLGNAAYELLPQSGKVLAISVKLAVKQAFHIMYEQGLPLVPLWDDCKGQVSGMLTASDFIMILRELHSFGSMLTSEELETHSVSSWKNWKVRISGNRGGAQRALILASPHDSLNEVASRILQNEICSIPIIHSSTPDRSSQQLLHLACLSGILAYICRRFGTSTGLSPLLQQPIYRLPIGTWLREIDGASGSSLTVLRANAPLSAALDLLIQAKISSVPIIDENGSLLDVYSRSDIMALANGEAYTYIQLDQTSMRQALQLAYQANSVRNGPFRCHTCLRSDTLLEIMQHLSDPVVRRLVVVEPRSRRIEGIITLKDVFSFLLG